MKKPEFRIYIAIINSNSTFRTVTSLAEELDMSYIEVQQGLDKIYDKVRVCSFTDKQGNLLYISNTQPATWREYYTRFYRFITKHI